MKSDDPEQRIRELERELADATAGARGPRYAPAGFVPPPRKTPILLMAIVLVTIAVLTGVAVLVAEYLRHAGGGNSGGNGTITMAQGGTLDVVGNQQNQTIVCNDSSLTLSANNSAINVSGHCASLKVTGFDDHVNIDSADTVEVSGFGSVVTERECNNGKLTLSGYGNSLSVTGHCAGLTVAAYNNRVQLDSADTVAVTNYGTTVSVSGHCGGLTVSAYDNHVRVDSADTIDVSGFSNTVTYHTGSPKISQSGYDIAVTQG
jgi:Protein of unknown function (DUF3060)